MEKECLDYVNVALSAAGSALNYSSLQSLADNIALIETQVNTLKNRSIQLDMSVSLANTGLPLPNGQYFFLVSQPTGTRITAVDVIQAGQVEGGDISWNLTSLSSPALGSVQTFIVAAGPGGLTAPAGTFFEQAVACAAGAEIRLVLILGNTITSFTASHRIRVTLSYN